MPPLQEGILSIKVNSSVKAIKRWNKRFVLLSPDSIVPFYAESQMLKPDLPGRIYLAHIIRMVQPKAEPDKFEVHYIKRKPGNEKGLKTKRVSFQAESTKEARQWVRALISAIRSVHTDLSQQRSSLPARKRFSLPFVVTHFGYAGFGRDEQIAQAFSPRRRSIFRQRSMCREARRASNSQHGRTLSQAAMSSLNDGSSMSSGVEVETALFSGIASIIFNSVEESDLTSKKALLHLLGDDAAILQTLITLTDPHTCEAVCVSLPSNLGAILLEAMQHRRFGDILESVLRVDASAEAYPNALSDDIMCSIIRLRWWALHEQLRKRELSRNSVRDHFACFLNDYVNGDKFTIAAKDTAIQCLKGWKNSDMKAISCPEVWKGLLKATLNCPMDVKNETFKDIAFLVVDSSSNAESLYRQPQWVSWLLQPVLFQSSADMDKHMRLRMLFLTLIHFHLFFSSNDAEGLLIDTLCRLHLWGLDGRVAANAMLECLVAKLHGAVNRFPHDFDTIPWKNLLRLLRVIQVFVFCTADWDKQHESAGRNKGGRRMSTTRVEAEPREPKYYKTALDDAKNPKTLGQRRFGPHLSESGESDIVESCFSLLKSLGLLESDFASVNVGRLDSVSAKAVAFEARELSCFFRDALIFMLLLELRESSLSQIQIRVMTRSFLAASNSTKRLEITQRLSRIPMCEVKAVQMLSGADRRASAKFASIVLQNSNPNREISLRDARDFVTTLMQKVVAGDRRVQMRVYRQCFTGSEVVKLLLDEKVAADVERALFIGTLLQGCSIISCFEEGSYFANSNVLLRFACHDDDKSSLDVAKIHQERNATELADGPDDGQVFDFLFEEENSLLSSSLPLDGEAGLSMTMTMSKAMSLAISKNVRSGATLSLLEAGDEASNANAKNRSRATVGRNSIFSIGKDIDLV